MRDRHSRTAPVGIREASFDEGGGGDSAVRSLLGCCTLIALGTLLGLGILESVLQAGAVWMRLTAPPRPVVWATGDRSVLCLGDSNTYGIYVSDRAQAYPQRLQSLWNETSGAPRIEVLNLGYPGINSSRLLRDLPQMLEILRPNVVLVLVGANDCWTVPVSIDGPTAFLERLGRFIQQHSRVYRLIYMLDRASGSGATDGFEIRDAHADEQGGSETLRVGDAEFVMGWQKGRYRSKFGTELDRNLVRIADVTKAAGAQLLLLTYPSEEANYGDANKHIRAAAQRTGTPVVDAAAVLQAVCSHEPCPAYFYDDHHPTARGYAMVARSVMRRLREIDGSYLPRRARLAGQFQAGAFHINRRRH